MSPQRLTILYVSQMPANPPRFGAQARMHGLMTQLARQHDLSAVMLVDDEFDIEECRRPMHAYCSDVALVPNPYGSDGVSKRLRQLRLRRTSGAFSRRSRSPDPRNPQRRGRGVLSAARWTRHRTPTTWSSSGCFPTSPTSMA
jgi:hypothetical protein